MEAELSHEQRVEIDFACSAVYADLIKLDLFLLRRRDLASYEVNSFASPDSRPGCQEQSYKQYEEEAN